MTARPGSLPLAWHFKVLAVCVSGSWWPLWCAGCVGVAVDVERVDLGQDGDAVPGAADDLRRLNPSARSMAILPGC